MKPGPAISVRETTLEGSSRRESTSSATFRGFCLRARATTMARFVARSPWPWSRGRSSTKGRSPAPSRSATRPSSSRIAWLTSGPSSWRTWRRSQERVSRPSPAMATSPPSPASPASPPSPTSPPVRRLGIAAFSDGFRLPGPLPVLAVIGDVEPGPLEHQPGPAGDLAHGQSCRTRGTSPGADRTSSGTFRTRARRGRGIRMWASLACD